MTYREFYSPIADCRLCGNRDLKTVLDLGLHALSGTFPKTRAAKVPSGPLTLLKCFDCGLVQLAGTYDLASLYGGDYGYRSGLNGSMVRHLHGKAKTIEDRIDLKPGDLVIDIGSNDGTLLRGYATDGLRLLGVDPTADKFRSYYPENAEVVADFFPAEAVKEHIGNAKARVVTSIACFYDLERPLEFAADVLDVLREDGLWVFEQSYLPAMIAARSYDTVCHEHLEYYAMAQIDYIAKQTGLKIVDVEFNDTNGGSFCVTASRASSPYQPFDYGDILMREEALGFASTEPFDGLKSFMESHRRRLRALLETLKRSGKTVLGYGASTKGNVLLQYCGIGRDLLPAIAEVNQDKFGCFTPGTGIPIISERDARDLRPDYFFVLPWHFRDSIIARESAFLSEGGRLIFPLPDAMIVWSRRGQVHQRMAA